MKMLNYKELKKLSTSAQKKYFHEVKDFLGNEFLLKDPSTWASDLPSFEHLRSQIEFKLIPGGEFTEGLTDEEEIAALAILHEPPLNISEMRPPKKMAVDSFLISATPVLFGQAVHLLDTAALSQLLKAVEPNPDAPVYAQRKTAIQVAKALDCRLPYEAEWEYACRAMTKTLFVWGNDIPPDDELEKWLDFGLPRKDWKANAFGLSLLFSGDWCMDEWTKSHEDGAEITKGVFVIKGCGSIFWPWQDQEWIWCMPSMRMPSTALNADGCAFRLVRELS